MKCFSSNHTHSNARSREGLCTIAIIFNYNHVQSTANLFGVSNALCGPSSRLFTDGTCEIGFGERLAAPGLHDQVMSTRSTGTHNSTETIHRRVARTRTSPPSALIRMQNMRHTVFGDMLGRWCVKKQSGWTLTDMVSSACVRVYRHIVHCAELSRECER